MIYFRQQMCPVSRCTNRVVHKRPDIKFSLLHIYISYSPYDRIDDPLQYCIFIMIKR